MKRVKVYIRRARKGRGRFRPRIVLPYRSTRVGGKVDSAGTVDFPTAFKKPSPHHSVVTPNSQVAAYRIAPQNLSTYATQQVRTKAVPGVKTIPRPYMDQIAPQFPVSNTQIRLYQLG